MSENTDRLSIILGVNGSLGAAVAGDSKMRQTDIVGVDLGPTSLIGHLKEYRQCDFRDRQAITRAATLSGCDQYQELFCISCIGSFGDDTFAGDKFDEERFYETVQVNLLGVAQFMLTLLHQPATRRMRVKVIIVGSTASYVGSRDVGYGVAKAGLNGLVISLSKCLASQGPAIIGINPGIFTSPMSSSVSEERQHQAARGDRHEPRRPGTRREPDEADEQDHESEVRRIVEIGRLPLLRVADQGIGRAMQHIS